MTEKDDFSKIIRDAADRGALQTLREHAKKLDRFCEAFLDNDNSALWDEIRDWKTDDLLRALHCRVALHEALNVFLKGSFDFFKARRDQNGGIVEI